MSRGSIPYALTLRLLQPEAGYQWYSIRFRSIRDETGRAIKLIGQLTNIHHQKLEEDRLRHEASTDLLTQIYNKITTEHLVSLELQEGRNHALIVVDLDKFKYANDTFGHLFGDSVIKAVAATLRATFRATDIVGRTGGDEFNVFADISFPMGSKPSKPNAGGFPSSSPMSPSGRIMSSRQASASACSRVTARPTPNCSPRPTLPCTRSKTRARSLAVYGEAPETGNNSPFELMAAKGCLSCPKGHETTPSVTTAPGIFGINK